MSDIQVKASALHCPACGALVSKDDDKCHYCGADLVGVIGRLKVATPQMAQAVADGLNYYDVLSIPANANYDQIESAYKFLLERYIFTPPAMVEEATRNIALLKQAYAVLSDAEERSAYDELLKHGLPSAPNGSPPKAEHAGPEVLAHGKGLWQLKMYAEAAEVFAKAAKLMPESAEAHYLYAAARLEAEREDIFGIAANVCQLVMEETSTAIALDPGLNEAVAYKALAQALYLKQNNQDSDARAQLQDAIYHKPDWSLPYHVLAGFAFQAGELDLAQQACLQALKLDPKNESVEFILANVRQRAQDTKGSKRQRQEKHR